MQLLGELLAQVGSCHHPRRTGGELGRRHVYLGQPDEFLRSLDHIDPELDEGLAGQLGRDMEPPGRPSVSVLGQRRRRPDQEDEPVRVGIDRQRRTQQVTGGATVSTGVLGRSQGKVDVPGRPGQPRTPQLHGEAALEHPDVRGVGGQPMDGSQEDMPPTGPAEVAPGCVGIQA